MPKRAMSFKPTSECEVQLAELMGRFKFDRTSVVIMAIDVAHRTLMVGSSEPPKVLPKDPKEVAKLAAAISKDVRKVTDTHSQQEKLDDFYRSNMAKGKK